MTKRKIFSLILVSSCLLGPGCDSDPQADAREKFLTCWNDYVYHHTAYVTFWNAFATSKNDGDKKELLRRCHDALDRIQPFSQLGVDPQLSQAMADVQRTLIAQVEFEQQQVGHEIDMDRRAELTNAAKAAQASLDTALNRVQAQLGGITVGASN